MASDRPQTKTIFTGRHQDGFRSNPHTHILKLNKHSLKNNKPIENKAIIKQVGFHNMFRDWVRVQEAKGERISQGV